MRRPEGAGGANGGERSIRRITNSIRPERLTSLPPTGEVLTRASGKPVELRGSVRKRRREASWVFGDGGIGSSCASSRETCPQQRRGGRCREAPKSRAGRSQSLRSSC